MLIIPIETLMHKQNIICSTPQFVQFHIAEVVHNVVLELQIMRYSLVLK